MQSKNTHERKKNVRRVISSSPAAAEGPLKVGLTGNIGSGKSTAVRFFQELGVPTFDTDSIGHALLDSDRNVQRRIVDTFGNRVIEDGIISRRKLGQIVFADHDKRRKLESILHPAIISAVESRISALGSHHYALVEVPLLYEAELSHHFDYVILVKSEKERAVARASSRLGLTRDEVLKRLDSQIPQTEKEKLADFVVANDGTEEDLRSRVNILHAIISTLRRDGPTDD